MNTTLEKSIMEIQETVNNSTIPPLKDWLPTSDQIYFDFYPGDKDKNIPPDDFVKVAFSKLGLDGNSKLSIFLIKKKNFRDRMVDITNTINYYLSYYDSDLLLLKSFMVIKNIIDEKPKLSTKAFIKLVMKEIITKKFVNNIKEMASNLYTLNIDSDSEGQYKNTPKITNAQAKLLVAMSFAIRTVIPLITHFSAVNDNFVNKKDYIPCFDKLVMEMFEKFEKNDVKAFVAIEDYAEYRVDRLWKQDAGTCMQKKQLYGLTQALYLEEIVHEVILVKSLYKLKYYLSVVSFIDGVIQYYHVNFKKENFKYKPVEIDSEETQDSDSDRISHAEAIEMMVYRVDESNCLINDANTKEVLGNIRKKIHVAITEEEFNYYLDNISISPITEMLLESFYDRFFHNPYAIMNLSDEIIIELIIRMKKFLMYKGMKILPQICTAKIYGKYKENTIKSVKFKEKIETSDVWKNIICKDYTYISEITQKENLLIKQFSILVNCKYEFIDYGGPDDNRVYEDIDVDILLTELSFFLSLV